MKTRTKLTPQGRALLAKCLKEERRPVDPSSLLTILRMTPKEWTEYQRGVFVGFMKVGPKKWKELRKHPRRKTLPLSRETSYHLR